MEQGITFEQVQKAMLHLRDQDERVSRRNVRSITGGGMSTVHKLMRMVEEQESLQNDLFAKEMSDSFLTAFKKEIAVQTKALTEKYEHQVESFQKREQELIEELTDLETKANTFEKKLESLKASTNKDRQQAEKDLAVARESICRLENWVTGYMTERKDIDKVLETVRAENVSRQCNIESLQMTVEKQRSHIDQLTQSLSDSRKELAAAEKKAAVAQQKLADLKDTLAKAT